MPCSDPLELGALDCERHALVGAADDLHLVRVRVRVRVRGRFRGRVRGRIRGRGRGRGRGRVRVRVSAHLVAPLRGVPPG